MSLTINHRSPCQPTVRSLRRWSPTYMQALAYAAQWLWRTATDHPHLTWREVAERHGFADDNVAKYPLDAWGVPMTWRPPRVYNNDVSYVMNTYCAIWGKPYPYREKRR